MTLTIGKRINVGFSLVLVLMVAVGVVGFTAVSGLMQSTDEIQVQAEVARGVNLVKSTAQDAQAASLRYTIYGDKKYLAQSNEACDAATKQAQETKALMKSEENRRNIDEVIQQIGLYKSANAEFATISEKRDAASETRAKAANGVTGKLDELLAMRRKAINDGARDTEKGKVAELDAVTKSWAVFDARQAFEAVRISAQKYQLATSAEEQDAVAKQWVADIAGLRKALETCKESLKDSESQKGLTEALAELAAYESQVDTFRQLSRQERDVQTNKQRPAAMALIARCDDVCKGVNTMVSSVSEAADRTAQLSRVLITTVAIGAALVGIIAAWLIARSIVRPVSRVVASLTEGADQVNDAAAQVAAASQQLAEGASEQASSLEETSSALEEMAAMTRTNAGNAKQANDLAASARKAADDGDKTMVQLNDAMSAINESSEKISKIIKVIEEIAFQTNLLALNAAVEAARAGEHGKGFAVVADEVRNLAQRAAQAAKETTALIEDSVNRARGGTQVASEVGKALGAIVGDVSKVSDLINGIAHASDEQAQGVEQVNTAVGQMDKVTQQNASGAEESASAAEELSAQAQMVKNVVNELAAMVGGRNSSLAATETAAAKQPAKRAAAKATKFSKASSKADPVAASAGAAHKGEEFLALDDKGLKDF